MVKLLKMMERQEAASVQTGVSTSQKGTSTSRISTKLSWF